MRRIAWNAVHDEAEALDLIRAMLPPEQATRSDVTRFLRSEELQAASAGPQVLYAYARGPRFFGSPVEVDWLIEFRFDSDRLDELVVEKRITAP